MTINLLLSSSLNLLLFKEQSVTAIGYYKNKGIDPEPEPPTQSQDRGTNGARDNGRYTKMHLGTNLLSVVLRRFDCHVASFTNLSRALYFACSCLGTCLQCKACWMEFRSRVHHQV